MNRTGALCLALLFLFPVLALCEAGQCARVGQVEEYVTLRDRASGRGRDIGHVPLGDLVVLLGTEEEGFMPISWQGKAGFARAQYLELVREKAGEEIPLEDALRIRLNLYLTQLTRFSFAEGTAYLQENPGLTQIAAFSRTWAGLDTALVPMTPEEAAAHFFGTDAPLPPAELLQDTGGFASVHRCTQVVPGLYRVEFLVLGAGMRWEPEGVSTLSQTRAIEIYGKDSLRGLAYVRGSLEESQGWVLNRYVTVANN